MKCTTENYIKVKEYLTKSLSNYIVFVNNYKCTYKYLWDNVEDWNNKLKSCESIEEFEWKYDIDLKQATEDKIWLDMLPVAKLVLQHVDEIHLNILDVFIQGDMAREYEYPNKVQEWLSHFQCFCIEDGIFISLTRQNELLKRYPHFNAAAKSQKTLKCLKDLSERSLSLNSAS